MTDEQWAHAGRALADALMVWAHSRSDDDKKRLTALQTEICRDRRQEMSDQLAAQAAAAAETAP